MEAISSSKTYRSNDPMSLFVLSEGDPDDQIVLPTPEDTRTEGEMVVMLLNTALGTGVCSLGYKFRCGALLAPIISTFIALISYYANYQFVMCVKATGEPTFEQIFKAIFGKYFVVIPAIISCTSNLTVAVFYTDFTLSAIKSLLQIIVPGLVFVDADNQTILYGFSLIVLFPIILMTRLKSIYIYSIIAFVCVLMQAVIFVIYFIQSVIEEGFNPGDQIVLFKFDDSAISCITGLLTAYLVMPLIYPSFNHVKGYTTNKGKWIFKTLITICWLYYLVVGYSTYFGLLGKNEGDFILDYYPDGFLRTLSYILIIVMMCLKMPMSINPTRYQLLMLTLDRKTFTNQMFVFSGVIVIVVLMVLESMTTIWGDVIGYACDISSILLIFGLPSICYLKIYGCKSPLQVLMSLMMFAIGIWAIVMLFM